MGVEITSVAIKNKFRNESVDWLLANVGDRITIELTFKVRSFVVASQDEPLILNAYDGMPPAAAGTSWVKDESDRFKDFRVGDTVKWFNKANNGTSSLTVLEKLSDGQIRFNGVFSGIAADAKHDQIVFSVSTPITALKYKWNFIENDDAPVFKSKVDGTEQELIVKSISAGTVTPVDMTFLGAKSYQTGSATAQGITIDNADIYTSNFKIIHNTIVTPFMLSDQWLDLLAGKNAPYFLNEKCLKAIFDIRASVDYNNPNWIQQETVFETKGETGGYKENFNTGLTNYYISSVVFKDSNTNIVPGVLLSNEETSVEITLKNTIDAPFSNTNTKFELQFIKAPNDPDEYQNNNRTLDQNFIDDRALQTLGAGAINGTNYGVSDRQVFKSVTGTYVSASEVLIKCQIAMLTDVLAVMAESEEARYIITLAVQKHSLVTKLADLVRLPVHISPFFISESDDGLVEIDNTYYRHYDSGIIGEGVKLNMVTGQEDEVVCKSTFFVDKDGRTSDIIKIESVTPKIKAKNLVTGQEFTLDDFTFSFVGLPSIGIAPYLNQFVDVSIDRVFLIPSSEIRKAIKIKRRTDLDLDHKAYYEIWFPFLVRWEYWVKYLKANGAFYDALEPNNGLNEEWFRYNNLANWGIFYELKVVMSKNNIPLTYKYENQFQVYDYDSNDIWNPNTIKSFDPDTLVELFDAGASKKFLLDNKNTLIRADFTKTTGTPLLSNCVINMHIEVFEEGGIEGTRRMSSAWPSDSNTWFKSIDLSNKTQLSLIGDTIRAEVLVNKDMLPDKAKYSIAARLYEKPGPFVCVCPDGYTFDEVNMNCKRTDVVKSGYIWYFGYNAKFDFNTLDVNNDPLFTTDGPIHTNEGCTVFAKDDGTVLLSTDGVNLYDDTDTLVVNDLAGSPSSTDSGVVVKSPVDDTLYYIFTTPAFEQATHYHCYSIYDSVAKAIVLGTKNTQIVNNSAEGLCAIHNSHGETFIITQNRLNGNYVITKLGSDASISTSEFVGGQYSAIGVGSISYNGKGKIVHALNEKGLFMMDFDIELGVISNYQTIANGNEEWYGAEFSPSGDILYAGLLRLGGNSKFLYQWDLSSNDITTIIASRYTVFATTGTNANSRGFGAARLAPNGKIYITTGFFNGGQTPSSHNGTYPFVAAINNPDVLGSGCNYNDEEVSLGDYGFSRFGLPSFDRTSIVSVATVPCAGACILPDKAVSVVCSPTSRIKIVMNDRGGRSWIVTDNKGTAPLTINSNQIYLFGTGYVNGAVQLTFTDSRRPECNISQTVTISC